MINNTLSLNTQTSTPMFKLPKKTTSGLVSSAPATVVTSAPKIQTSTPTTAIPKQTSSFGSYKGVQITPGSDADVAAQIARIDGAQQIPQQSAPVKGIFSDVQSSVQKQPTTSRFEEALNRLQVQSTAPNPVVNQATQGLMSGNYSQRLDDAIAAQKRAVSINQGLNQAINDQTKGAIPIEFVQGRQGALQRDYGVQADAATRAAQNAAEIAGITQSGLNQAGALGIQGQQLAQQGLTSVADMSRPVQVPYGNQFLDPATGQPVGGGVSGNIQNAVSQVAQMIQNGTMGYDAGVQALSAYGQAGINQLLQTLGPNFNVQQSNALAAAQSAATLQTGTLGGQLQKQAETVKTHMATLKHAYEQLQAQFGLPLINAGINAIASQFGSGPLQSYNIALSNVRDELAKILGGGTSTDGTRATARELLPDNMTPAQLTASIATATELMNSKIQEYTQIPQFSGSGAQAGGNTNNIWDW